MRIAVGQEVRPTVIHYALEGEVSHLIMGAPTSAGQLGSAGENHVQSFMFNSCSI